MVSSIDGLVSGLSTSDLISQLMQVEAAGQTRLKTRVTAQQKVNASYQSINTKIAALKTASTTVMDATAPIWANAKATASSDAVSVTASAGASTGQLTFDVKRLAQANTQTSTVASTGSIQNGAGLSVTIGTTTTPITVTTDTAQGVVDAINGAGIGVKAALVSTEQGTTVLQLNATKTGTANAFTVNGLTAPLTQMVTAQDAQIGVGTVGAGGYTVTSASNTFTNLMPNVSITAKRVETGVTVTVSADADAIANKVQAMVEAANGLLTELGTQSAITPASSTSTSPTGAPLAGNSMVRQLQQSLLSAVSIGESAYGSFKQLGIQTDRNGKLVFDRSAFLTAYQADPAKVQAAVTNGIGKSFKTLSTEANNNVTAVIQSGASNVRYLTDQIANWDVRLTAKQEALQKQFTNLEVALGKLKDQSSWLAGQIAQLG